MKHETFFISQASNKYNICFHVFHIIHIIIVPLFPWIIITFIKWTNKKMWRIGTRNKTSLILHIKRNNNNKRHIIKIIVPTKKWEKCITMNNLKINWTWKTSWKSCCCCYDQRVQPWPESAQVNYCNLKFIYIKITPTRTWYWHRLYPK